MKTYKELHEDVKEDFEASVDDLEDLVTEFVRARLSPVRDLDIFLHFELPDDTTEDVLRAFVKRAEAAKWAMRPDYSEKPLRTLLIARNHGFLPAMPAESTE